MSDENSVIEVTPARARRRSAVTMLAKKRVTFAIPEALDQALEIYCSGTGQMKNEIATAALAEYLSQRRKRLQSALTATNTAISRLFPPSSRTRRA